MSHTCEPSYYPKKLSDTWACPECFSVYRAVDDEEFTWTIGDYTFTMPTAGMSWKIVPGTAPKGRLDFEWDD